MITTLNALIDAVEHTHDEVFDVAAFARAHGTTEYHVRRMFAALAHVPLSEYVRRRRMTLAAADLVQTNDSLLDVAVRYGYGSVEAFGRAFRSVHDESPAGVRKNGGPLRTQTQLRFRLSVEGSSPMDVTITARPAFKLVGYAVDVPLIHTGVNPQIQAHIAALAPEVHVRLKALSNTDPAGILAITDAIEPDVPEGTLLTYMHGVAIAAGSDVPADLDTIAVAAGSWAVFVATGSVPAALQSLWAATATDWFPSNPWRLRPGPSLVRYVDFTPEHATCELWLPVEPA